MLITGTVYRIEPGEKMPSWIASHLTPYKRADGTTGYEFYGASKIIDLKEGDILIRTKQGIKFKKSA